MHQWVGLDKANLIDSLGETAEQVKVIERATDAEIKNRGAGCRYIAGAVEKATRGRVTMKAIMGGQYGRRVVAS